MRYDHFKYLIGNELRRVPAGLTWAQLKKQLDLPYDRPCPTWVKRLEDEIGLSRTKGCGAAYVWSVSARKKH